MKTIDEMIEILQGFKAGKKYQCEIVGITGKWWEDIESLNHILEYLKDEYNIRQIPEPKLVPYGPEDGAWLVGRKAKSKSSGYYFLVDAVLDIYVYTTNNRDSEVSFETLLSDFLDVTDTLEGVPFGREVVE